MEPVQPQVIVMDGRMPVMNGVIATQHLRAAHPEIAVVAHTADDLLGEQMMQMGAVAHVPKGSGELVATLKNVLRGAGKSSGSSRQSGMSQLRPERHNKL